MRCRSCQSKVYGEGLSWRGRKFCNQLCAERYQDRFADISKIILHLIHVKNFDLARKMLYQLDGEMGDTITGILWDAYQDGLERRW